MLVNVTFIYTMLWPYSLRQQSYIGWVFYVVTTLPYKPLNGAQDEPLYFLC